MRALILRVTLLLAAAAALTVVALDLAAEVAVPVMIGRASLAVGIVGAAGLGVGAILMRTVLRRRYEERRVSHAPPRARADR